MEYQASRAILVGVCTNQREADELEKSLCELERLLDTAGGMVFARVMQSRPTLDPATVIGSGKVEEIASLCGFRDVKYFYVIFKKLTGYTTKEYKRSIEDSPARLIAPI